MMVHRRKAIRQAVVNVLKGIGEIGANVYPNRSTPLWAVKLPAALVYSLDEQSEANIDQTSTILDRELMLAIEARQEATDALDDMLDALAFKIESAINTNSTLSGIVLRMTLVSTELDFDGTGEVPFGAIRLSYRVHYADFQSPITEEDPE